jgi:hypothetical protein
MPTMQMLTAGILPEGKAAELPTTYCNASARGLAYMGAFMANKGSYDGKVFLSEEAWTEYMKDPEV